MTVRFLARSVAVVGVLATLVPSYTDGAASQETGKEHPVELEITLEDTLCVEGQAIHMIIQLRNPGGRAIPSMAPILPGWGGLRLSLVDLDRDLRVPGDMPGGPLLGTYSLLTVDAAGTISEVRDLLKYFGKWMHDGGFSHRLGFAQLAAGRYRLEWEYAAGPNAGGGQSGSVHRGNKTFRILGIDAFPDEKSLVEEFLERCPAVRVGGDRSPIHHYAQEWLPRFYGSRYLSRVFLAQGVLLNERPFLEVYRGAVEAGAPPERTAALLALRMSMTDLRGEYTDEWRKAARDRARSRLEREVLLKRPRRPEAPTR